jgi:hypothetical protein
MKHVVMAAVAWALLGVMNTAWAVNPSGVWTWIGNINDQTRLCTLKLRLDSEGSVLSGFYSDDQLEKGIPISPAIFRHEDARINFAVTREYKGETTTVRCVGTFNGDFINGTTYVEINGDVKSSNWVARRQP